MSAVHVIIRGRVQGVWYRGWTIETALALGLDGWVRNRRDGTVEAVFSGSDTAIADMIRACRAGPPLAEVTAIDQEPTAAPTETGFHQRPTV